MQILTKKLKKFMRNKIPGKLNNHQDS